MSDLSQMGGEGGLLLLRIRFLIRNNRIPQPTGPNELDSPLLQKGIRVPHR
jgi:hypothetical protein